MCKPHRVETATETLQLLGYNVLDRSRGVRAFVQSEREFLLQEVGWLAHAGGQEPLTMDDCAAAFLILSQAKAGDTLEITERRKVCAQLAELAGSPVYGNALSLAVILHKFAVLNINSDDSRKRTFAEHAAREAEELDAAAI